MFVFHKYLSYFIFILIISCLLTPLSFADEIDDITASGENEFRLRCAICHGEDGKGDGPYAFALVYKPADLTRLLIKYDGQFPFLETFLIIDGREVIKSHGTRVMPIWGDRFTEESWSIVSPEYAQTLARGRIFELLLYIYSIQEPE